MPNDRFRRLVRAQTVARPDLPSVHSTDAYTFRTAVEEDALIPTPCKVFNNEPLLYLFYGRPAYRVNPDEEPSGLDHYLPVCILVRSTSVIGVKRTFPFDTGAFHANRYDNAMHRHMKIEDFGLDPDPSTPGRVISLFFGTVRAYLEAHSLPQIHLDPTDFEARSYRALISQQMRSNTDDRTSGIELQLDSPLALHSAAEAIVAPGPLLESPHVWPFLQSNGILPLPYEQLGRQRPSEHVTDLFRICLEYYRNIKLII